MPDRPTATTVRTGPGTTAPAAGQRPQPARPGPTGPGRTGPGPDRRAQALARVARGPAALPPEDQLADAERLAAALGRWYLEAQAGRRDPRQLRRLLTPAAQRRVLSTVRRSRDRFRDTGTRPGAILTVRRVLVARARHHYEALALVDDGLRTVAVTAVLQPAHHGWVVRDLVRPDDGLDPLHGRGHR